MSERWMPDFSDKRTMTNFAAAAAVPGLLGYLIARYADGRKNSKEGARFAKIAEEMAMAENPVMSLDPHLDDIDEEARLRDLGLKHAETEPAGGTPGPEVTPESPSRFSGLLEPGMMAALAYLSILTGAAAGKKARYRSDLKTLGRQLPHEMNLLEKSEYDRLFQLNDPEGYEAHLATLKGKQKKAERIARTSVPKVAYTEGDMLNAAVQLMGHRQTEARILNAVPKTAYAAKQAPKAPETLIPHTAFAAPIGFNRSVSLLSRIGGPLLKGLKAGGRVIGRHPKTTVGIGVGTYFAPEIKRASGSVVSTTGAAARALPVLVESLQTGGKNVGVAAGNAYPVLFTALLMTGLAAGKTFGDSQDVNRANKKALEKYLNRELVEQQSPAILDVGSPLPWEAARHGGARQAAKGELPEDARLAEAKAAQEIRI